MHQWSRQIWAGVYTGQHLYPFLVLFAPVSLLPVDLAAAIFFVLMLVSVVFTLKRDSLRWIFFVPLLQSLYLGQLDPLFWLVYRAERPALWALLTLKPQLLIPALPRVFASKRNVLEFLGATVALHAPFLILRPTWPLEWIRLISAYAQNRITRIPHSTTSASIVFSAWVVPFAALLLVLVLMRRKNLEGAFFLANPFMFPYDYSLLLGRISRWIIPLSWLALAAAWKVQAGWPYAVVLAGVLVLETIRERRGKIDAPSGN